MGYTRIINLYDYKMSLNNLGNLGIAGESCWQEFTHPKYIFSMSMWSS